MMVVARTWGRESGGVRDRSRWECNIRIRRSRQLSAHQVVLELVIASEGGESSQTKLERENHLGDEALCTLCLVEDKAV